MIPNNMLLSLRSVPSQIVIKEASSGTWWEQIQRHTAKY